MVDIAIPNQSELSFFRQISVRERCIWERLASYQDWAWRDHPDKIRQLQKWSNDEIPQASQRAVYSCGEAATKKTPPR